jgi:hypothetical protein
VNRGASTTHLILAKGGSKVSAGHIVTTPSLGFHLTVFVRTHRAEAELSFDFEPEDIHADWLSELVAANGVAAHSDLKFMSRKVEIARNITKGG